MNPFTLVGRTWHEMTLTTLLFCLSSLYVGGTSAVVHGERYTGPVVRVMGIIGQQQCVRECRHRPKLCRGVNYRKQELLCELVSAINETEPNPDYVRIELDQVIFLLFFILFLFFPDYIYTMYLQLYFIFFIFFNVILRTYIISILYSI